jgi:hypothetical protein
MAHGRQLVSCMVCRVPWLCVHVHRMRTNACRLRGPFMVSCSGMRTLTAWEWAREVEHMPLDTLEWAREVEHRPLNTLEWAREVEHMPLDTLEWAREVEHRPLDTLATYTGHDKYTQTQAHGRYWLIGESLTDAFDSTHTQGHALTRTCAATMRHAPACAESWPPRCQSSAMSPTPVCA